jgi:hypothetical protein
VPIHGGEVGEALVGREDAGILEILRDEEAHGVGLVGVDIVDHLEQGIAQRALLSLAGTDDGGDGEHSGSSSSLDQRKLR